MRNKRKGRTGPLPLEGRGYRAVMGVAIVFVLALCGLNIAWSIPASPESQSAGYLVSAIEMPARSSPPPVRGLACMPPRRGQDSPKKASPLESLRSIGGLRGYSVPADRVVFLADGAAQYVPPPPWPSKPVPGTALYCGNREKPRVALTFDDGYGGMTRLLDTLVQLRVPATIFPTGGVVSASPSMIERARSLGFEIANHSTTHPTFTKIPNDVIVREVLGCDQAVRNATGDGTVAYLRPPGGSTDARVTGLLGAIGYTSVLWDHDTIDWSPATTPQQLIARATDGVKNGAIILMHSQGKYTCDVLPQIVKTLRDRGFELTTVSGVLSND